MSKLNCKAVHFFGQSQLEVYKVSRSAAEKSVLQREVGRKMKSLKLRTGLSSIERQEL